ncbi:MAG: hypothetical protein OSJ72_13050 [Lachnospiraceae bacterium]|nr:hypothetical protein [Lachnospiraceae bacterium]
MTKTWSVTDSMGNNHHITFQKGGFGGAKCIVDGDAYKMKSKNWVIWMADHQISIPGAECNLVVVGNKVRLAVNGIYLEDGTPYEPIRNIPMWVNVLTLVNLIIGWFMIGLLGVIITILGDLLTFNLCLKRKNSVALVVQIVLLVFVIVGGYFIQKALGTF